MNKTIIALLIAGSIFYIYYFTGNNSKPADSEINPAVQAGNDEVMDQEEVEAKNNGAAGGMPNPYFQENTLEGDMIDMQNSQDDNNENDHAQIIGLSLEEAEAYARTNEVAFRTSMIDGRAQPLTEDYQPGRITAEVVAGTVASYTVE